VTRLVDAIAAEDLKERPDFKPAWRPAIVAMQPAIAWAVNTYGQRLVTQSMLSAIISRESNFQNIFQAGVPRGPGCGVGPCQITAGVDWTDVDHPTLAPYGDLTVVRNNLWAAVAGFLVPALVAFPGSHRDAFDSYNLGVGGVEQELSAGEDPDALTTGGNYGTAVFDAWITYAAIALGVSVDWTGYTP